MKTPLIAITLLAALSTWAIDQQPHRSPTNSFSETNHQLGLIKNTNKAFPGTHFSRRNISQRPT